MLQSLLQPRENQRSKMIGAMPAVAVRHERRRAEKRGGGGRRPSQLPLQLGRAGDAEATPSPDQHRLRNELFLCGKAALHVIVGALLLGIVVMVVGLVQLSPGAEAAQHRYYLMGAGAVLMGSGILGAILRCICLHWYNRKYREEEEEHEAAHKNVVSVVESGHGHHEKHQGHDHKGHDHRSHDHKSHEKSHGNHDKPGDHKEKTSHEHKHDKPKLKAQASVGKDFDLVKQPSAASDT